MMDNKSEKMQIGNGTEEKMTIESGGKLWIAMDTEQEAGIKAVIGTAKSKGEMLQKVGTYALSGGKTTYLELGYIDMRTGTIHEAENYTPEGD